jgi:hypothetical protein
MGKSYVYTIYLGTPNATGGYLVDSNFIFDNIHNTYLPVIHPDTEEPINVGDPIVDLTQPIDVIMKETAWIESKVNATQDVADGGDADILYYDSTDGLSIGRWGDGEVTLNNMMFTQFGSVIGFTNVGVWDNRYSIEFNPTSTYSYAYNSIPNYGTSPTAWAGTVAASPSVSSSAYHNGTNVKAGRGDICKLVGLTDYEASQMSIEQLDDYDSGWRLATARENVSFVGGALDYGTWQDWKAGDSWFSYSNATPDGTNVKWQYYYDSTGVRTTTGGNSASPATGRFPVVSDNYDNGAFSKILPAAGKRIDIGAEFDHGVGGLYWSSTALSSSDGYCLEFGNTGVNACGNVKYACGYAVRCVRP